MYNIIEGEVKDEAINYLQTHTIKDLAASNWLVGRSMVWTIFRNHNLNDEYIYTPMVEYFLCKIKKLTFACR